MRRRQAVRAWAVLAVALAAAPVRAGQPDSLAHDGGVWLGASVREAAADSTGVEITAVDAGGPAAGAGIVPGDIVVRIDGIAVRERRDFIGYIQTRRPGDRLRITVRSAQQAERTVQVTLAATRDDTGGNWMGRLQGTLPAAPWLQGRPRLGIEVMELDTDLAAYFRAPAGAGVLVTRVEPGGPGARGGLRAGDVLLAVAGHNIAAADDIAPVLETHNDGDLVEVAIWRREKRQTLRVAVESRRAWFGRTRPATAAPAPATEELRREVQRLRREVDELRREVDILRRRR